MRFRFVRNEYTIYNMIAVGRDQQSAAEGGRRRERGGRKMRKEGRKMNENGVIREIREYTYMYKIVYLYA